MRKILCVIGARGGSKGVRNKNIRPILGIPLIELAIKKALSISEINQVIVSTDSKEIALIAKNAGALVPFIRPSNLANSDSGKFQVWQHALSFCESHFKTTYDLFIDIDCTNPLIDASDIQNTISFFDHLENQGKLPDSVFTISEARRNPYFNLVEPDPSGILSVSKTLTNTQRVLSRQAAPPVFEHVAGTYVLRPDFIHNKNHLLDGRSFGYEVQPDKAFDIDSELDFELIEFLLLKNKNQKKKPFQ